MDGVTVLNDMLLTSSRASTLGGGGKQPPTFLEIKNIIREMQFALLSGLSHEMRPFSLHPCDPPLEMKPWRLRAGTILRTAHVRTILLHPLVPPTSHS